MRDQGFGVRAKEKELGSFFRGEKRTLAPFMLPPLFSAALCAEYSPYLGAGTAGPTYFTPR